MSMASAFADATPRVKPELKGRQARRSVTRRSLLLDLALPTHKSKANARKLSDRQTVAAIQLHRDLEAKWKSSSGLTFSYGAQRGGGDAPLRNDNPPDYDAMDRITHLMQHLHAHQRKMLGEIERLSFEAKGSIDNLPLDVGFQDEKMRGNVILGEVRSLLSSVADLYGIAAK
jgi:hypothetical protein